MLMGLIHLTKNDHKPILTVNVLGAVATRVDKTQSSSHASLYSHQVDRQLIV